MKEKIKKALKWFLNSYIWLFVILLVVDIVSKNIVMKNMYEAQSIDLIPGFLRLTYVQNRHAAFGLGIGGDGPNGDLINRIIYLVIALVASAGIIAYFIKKYNEIKPYIKACLMLILVGALGNSIDRLFYANSGYAVVDFIDFYFLSFWTFVFNIADCGVVIGAFMLLVYFIIEEVNEVKAKRAKELEEINAKKEAEKPVEQPEQAEENKEQEQ